MSGSELAKRHLKRLETKIDRVICDVQAIVGEYEDLSIDELGEEQITLLLFAERTRARLEDYSTGLTDLVVIACADFADSAEIEAA